MEPASFLTMCVQGVCLYVGELNGNGPKDEGDNGDSTAGDGIWTTSLNPMSDIGNCNEVTIILGAVDAPGNVTTAHLLFEIASSLSTPLWVNLF